MGGPPRPPAGSAGEERASPAVAPSEPETAAPVVSAPSAAKEREEDDSSPSADAPKKSKPRRSTRPSLAELKEIWRAEDTGERVSTLDDEEEAAFAELASSEAEPQGEGESGRPRVVSFSEIPMFRDLPEEAFEVLKARAIHRDEPSEKVIVRQGDPGNAFFVLLSGRVRVEKRGEGGEPVRLANLGPGSFFGEFALLSDRKRHATVVTEQPSTILEISRKIMGRLAKKHKEVAKILRRFYRRRLLSTVMQSTPFFGPLGPEEKKRLMGHLRFRKFSPGDRIVEEGAKGGGFYLILIGEVKVTKSLDGEAQELARMGEGAYFGEMSLLKNRPTVATVSAVSHTEVVEIGAKDFYRILGDHPEVWQDVQKEARRRELANHALLTGKSSQVTTPDGGVVI
jgi:CRP-like cAMP-binding protein